MSVSSKNGGSVTHLRIECLRLRVPAFDARAAKALAMAVASGLASRARDLEGVAGRETVRARIIASNRTSRDRLARAIAAGIANPQSEKQGRR